MHSSCQTLIGRSEVAINEINQPQEEKNLLFVNKKKQKKLCQSGFGVYLRAELDHRA